MRDLLFAFVASFVLSLAPYTSVAQTVVNVNVHDVIPKVELSFSPAAGSFEEGSRFEVSIYINTKGSKVNTVDLHVKFDPSKLRIIKPSDGTSIIGLWIGAPSYDNTAGTLHIAGAIPGGAATDSGLMLTVTFQALSPGKAAVAITDDTQVLLNDGLGSSVEVAANHALYTIVPRAPAGPQVFSDTHPFPDHWYNNPNPVISWNAGSGSFSYVFDTIPTTVPPNTVNATSSSIAMQDVRDGVWYFHVKELRNGVWGIPTHFAIHIDTTPPAAFTPTAGYLSAAALSRFLISFFTTDNLSGIDHYEVGIIDKSQPTTASPVFVQTDSPYQIPYSSSANLIVIVRAFDRAGNVREGKVSVSTPFFVFKLITDNAVVLLIFILACILGALLFHYFLKHHMLRRMQRLYALLKREEKEEELHALQKDIQEETPPRNPPSSDARI